MPDIRDQSYLEREQYKDASHLSARIQLHQCFSTNYFGWFKWVFDQLVLSTAATILEIGCGPGNVWVENRDRIPAGCHIYLSDFSIGMVREAKINLGLHWGNLYYESSNAMAIPFPNATFDAVLANHMLYHVPDRQRALREINRVLKSNGQLFAATNGEDHLQELEEIINFCNPSAGGHYSLAFSMGGFTLDNGTEQLTPWFTQIEVHYYDDALIVTEARPLVDYFLSMIPRAGIIPDRAYETRLTALVNDMIRQHGVINIQKSTGLFSGVKRILDE
jgi:SAM-dependent methyltransferase